MNEIARFVMRLGQMLATLRMLWDVIRVLVLQFCVRELDMGAVVFPKMFGSALFREKSETPFRILEAVHEVNETQREFFLQKLFALLPNIPQSTIALWGFRLNRIPMIFGKHLHSKF